MRRKHATAFGGLVGMAVLAGCGETAGLDGGLERHEVVELVEAVMSAAFDVTPEPAPELTVQCPLGGWATAVTMATVDIDPDTGEAVTVGVSATLRHEGCAVGIFTIDAAAGLTFAFELTAAGNPPTMTAAGTVTGSVRWRTTDGRQGACEFDLALSSGDITQTPVAVTLSGRACGEGVALAL